MKRLSKNQVLRLHKELIAEFGGEVSCEVLFDWIINHEV